MFRANSILEEEVNRSCQNIGKLRKVFSNNKPNVFPNFLNHPYWKYKDCDFPLIFLFPFPLKIPLILIPKKSHQFFKSMFERGTSLNFKLATRFFSLFHVTNLTNRFLVDFQNSLSFRDIWYVFYFFFFSRDTLLCFVIKIHVSHATRSN